MGIRKPSQLRPEPPPTVMEAFRKRLAGRNLQEVETLFAFRTTAQQVDNAITEWLAHTAASPAGLFGQSVIARGGTSERVNRALKQGPTT